MIDRAGSMSACAEIPSARIVVAASCPYGLHPPLA